MAYYFTEPTLTMADHLKAKKIAADWHGGQASPLYAICSTGAIVPGLAEEIIDCRLDADKPERPKLTWLTLIYIPARGQNTGPQPFWDELHW